MTISFAVPCFRTFTIFLGGFLAVTVASSSFQQALGQTNSYLVTELPGDDASQVRCKLNNHGDVVGRGGNAVEGESRATIWKRSTGKSKHLGALSGGDYSSASDINDLEEVAGVSNMANGIAPFLWTAKGGLQRLALLPGDSCGQAIGINKHGHIVGYSSGPAGSRAFLWARQTGIRELGSLPGGNHGRARDLNDSDEIVGTSASPAGERAVLWTKSGDVRDLGTLPGDWASEAAAINNAGDVVGYSKGPTGMRAFRWTKRNGIQELGVLPGGTSSRALDVSDLGEVVGSSTSASGNHAFIWTEQTGMTDLNSTDSADLTVVFIEAHAINHKGQILVAGRSAHEVGLSGNSVFDDNQHCAPAPPATFLLTPTASN